MSSCPIRGERCFPILSLFFCHSGFVIRHTRFDLAIRVYQLTISPAQVFLFGPTGGCRFTPTCSQYAMDAIREHGVLAGGWLAVKRICRCHPWGGCGHDPAPRRKWQVEKDRRRNNFGTHALNFMDRTGIIIVTLCAICSASGLSGSKNMRSSRRVLPRPIKRPRRRASTRRPVRPTSIKLHLRGGIPLFVDMTLPETCRRSSRMPAPGYTFTWRRRVEIGGSCSHYPEAVVRHFHFPAGRDGFGIINTLPISTRRRAK